MTLRKPVNQAKSQPDAQAVPYSATPLATEQGIRGISGLNLDGSMESNIDPGHSNNPWRSSNGNPWDGSHGKAADNEVPPILKPGGGRQLAGDSKTQGTPRLLQNGSGEETPRSSWDSQRSAVSKNNAPSAPNLPSTQTATLPHPASESTNPYHRSQVGAVKPTEEAYYGTENSADIWGAALPTPHASQEPPLLKHPFAEPWMKFETSPVEQGHPGPETVRKPSVNPWAIDPPETADASTMNHTIQGQAIKAPASSEVCVNNSDISTQPYGHEALDASQFPNPAIEESKLLQATDSGDPSNLSHTAEQISPRAPREDVGPPLPSRASQEVQAEPPPQPPRSLKDQSVDSEAADAQGQRVEPAKPKRAVETYQIRHVNWYDASSPTNPRRSPIMVQNANGPCPLLALVNALVLSTPADYATALVETLRVREQVSLGLLLDAVIDELIGRNGDLTDVSDMYAFLLALHTGMNANPIFVPKEYLVNLMDAPLGEASPPPFAHPSHSRTSSYTSDLSAQMVEPRQPGGFEETHEMRLYSTFAIPLIHGWLPPRTHPAFTALMRTAKTYEDAQNLMFKEEELEEKLQRQGLSSEEQTTLEDIATVKYFLSSTATQLTGYGLDIMTETMALGSVAILFRNNHFSTLYRHPKSGQLLTLVTDMGYASHDEVVWESLVDVNGEGCELFSGDFRPVGNNVDDIQQQSHSQNDEGWTTVNNRSRRSATANQQSWKIDFSSLSSLDYDTATPPPATTTEQQDHDLALAMHLQEEEEERDRQEAAARRRREDELSQKYLNNSDASGRRTFPGFSAGATAAQSGPSPPPRGRGSGTRAGSGRGAPSSRPTPPRKPIETDDAPPPTYEQAARGPAYHPPTHQPPYPSPTSPNASGSAQQRPPPQPNRPKQSSAYTEHAASYGLTGSPYSYSSSPRRGGMQRGGGMRGGVDPGLVRRRTEGTVDEEERKEKEKDCVVM